MTAPMASGAMTPASVMIEKVMASVAARWGCGVGSLTIIGMTTKMELPMAAPTTRNATLRPGVGMLPTKGRMQPPRATMEAARTPWQRQLETPAACTRP
jgi:hypothetical protein